MYIGHNLLRQREAKGWSQLALGESAGGISQSTISLLENNQQEAKWDQIEALAKALDVAPDQLIYPMSGPVYHTHIENGDYKLNNHGSGYTVHQNDDLATFKDLITKQQEEIGFLRSQISAMNEIIRSFTPQ